MLNKIDLARSRRRSTSRTSGSSRVFRVSAATGAGLDELKRALFELVPPRRRSPDAEPATSSSTSSSTGRSRAPRASGSSAPRAASASPARRRPRRSSRRSSGRGRARGRRGRGRRGGARVAVTALRRRLRPAASRPRRARATPAKQRFGVERLRRPRLASARAQGRRRCRRGSPRARARCLPGRRRAARPVSAHGRAAAGRALRRSRSSSSAPTSSRDFLDWTEPDEVLERARLAVATRPGFPRSELDAVLAQLARPERVVFFEIEPNPAASTESGPSRRRRPLDGCPGRRRAS